MGVPVHESSLDRMIRTGGGVEVCPAKRGTERSNCFLILPGEQTTRPESYGQAGTETVGGGIQPIVGPGGAGEVEVCSDCMDDVERVKLKQPHKQRESRPSEYGQAGTETVGGGVEPIVGPSTEVCGAASTLRVLVP